jgi:uncharacterized membrane protein YbhN (UPF0104 family)
LAVPFLAALTGFFAVALFPAVGRFLARLMLLPLPKRLRPPAERLIMGFLTGFRTLRSPRQVFATGLLTVPVWVLEAAMYYLIAVGFKIGQPFASFLLTTSTSNLATSLPSSAGGVGPFEYATRLTLEAMGVASEPAAAYAIVLHVALLVPVTVLGLVLLWLGNVSLREVAQQSVAGAERPTRPLPAAGDGSK